MGHGTVVQFFGSVAILASAPSVDAATISSVALHCLQSTFTQSRRPPRKRPTTPSDLQKAAAEANGTTDAARVKEFWERVERVQTALKSRNVRLPVWNTPEGRIGAIVDKAHVGHFATEDGPTRYFAFHLQVANDTPQPIAIAREQLRAAINGDIFPTQEIGPRLVHHGFPYGGDYFPLEACQPARELKLPPRSVAGTWLVYANQPPGQTLPSCKVVVQLADHTIEVPVIDVQRALLDIGVESMGPQQTLALISLGGLLNTFNIYSLIDTVEALGLQKTTRVVVQWKPNVPLPESQVLNWLQNSALGASTGRVASEQLPSFPSAIRELHLVEPVAGTFLAPEFTSHPQAPPKVHPSASEAVAEALRTMYVTLPREDLLSEIRRGHPLSSAAAMIHGAPRLQLPDLPLVLEHSRSDHAAVRRAALLALGDFDAPASLERLEQALRGQDAVDRTTAAIALSESRYQAARERFLEIVASGDAAFERTMALVLAQRPRAEFADLLLKHARDNEGRLQIDIVRALVQLGEPRLVDVLEPALRGSDASLQEFAFRILADRHDERSEQLASRFALERLRSAPPDAPLLAFLNRTKDPRAIPLLLKHLESSRDKAPLINLLGQIGDTPVGDVLVQRFDKLQTHEQVAVLIALRQLRHPRFVDVAADALGSRQDVVVTHAIQGLAQQGGRDAERLLCGALQTLDRPVLLETVALTIANLGSPEGRQALQQARASELEARRTAGLRGLFELRKNSPGWAAIEQGQNHIDKEEWAEALESFSLAAQLDPQLPEAFSGQGDVHLKQSRFPEAEKAFAEAYRLDAYNGLACCGQAIAMVLLGRLEEGRTLVENARPRFPKDLNFSYNAACFYGRAAEMTAKQPPSTERDALVEKYRRQSLADLAQAVKLGFRDTEWMQKDPDLKSLHDAPEFMALVKEAETK